MTDKEILEEVYRRLNGPDPHGWKTNPLKDGVTSFIEQEWQKRDELEAWRTEMFTKNDDGQMYKLSEEDVGLYLEEAKHSLDAKDIERHVGLEIGEDGTVKEIK